MSSEDEALLGEEAGLLKSRTGFLVAMAVLGVLLIVGVVTHLVGVGFLGYRSLLFGRGDLYILNLSDEERFVVVDGRSPVVIHSQDAQLVELIGGRSKVEILDDQQKLWRSFEIEIDDSHGLLNISDEACLAVTDLSGLYKGESSSVAIKTLLEAGEEIHILGSTNVVWPRREPPPRVDLTQGPALSVEIVGCALLQEPEFLREYLLLRLEERMGSPQK